MSDSSSLLEALQQEIHDLQSRLAYQEDMLQSLNEVVASQDSAITQMQRQIKQYKERLEDLVFGAELNNNQPPPHY